MEKKKTSRVGEDFFFFFKESEVQDFLPLFRATNSFICLMEFRAVRHF